MSPRSARSRGAAERAADNGARASGSGGNGKVAHLSVAERAARGKAARAEVPRASTVSGWRRQGVVIRSSCWRSRRRRASRSWCRSAMGGCWSRRLRSTAARRI